MKKSHVKSFKKTGLYIDEEFYEYMRNRPDSQELLQRYKTNSVKILTLKPWKEIVIDDGVRKSGDWEDVQKFHSVFLKIAQENEIPIHMIEDLDLQKRIEFVEKLMK